MDPQVCYMQWLAALNREGGEDFETAEERAEDLVIWIKRGGWEPLWQDGDIGRDDFYAWCDCWGINY
jgi:hypothetical protein